MKYMACQVLNGATAAGRHEYEDSHVLCMHNTPPPTSEMPQSSLDKSRDICHDIYDMTSFNYHDTYDIYEVKLHKETKKLKNSYPFFSPLDQFPLF